VHSPRVELIGRLQIAPPANTQQTEFLTIS
jgi:hypothetical protein